MPLADHDVLLVTDVQNDFLPGRRLAVAGGDAIVPIVDALAQRFAVLRQDRHPRGHLRRLFGRRCARRIRGVHRRGRLPRDRHRRLARRRLDAHAGMRRGACEPA